MHIPDGFLDAKTAITTGVLAAGGLAVALREANRHMPRRRIPLMGLSAAFIFAAQMLNFPVAGGTSGHLVGGVLAAVLLGPAAAVVVMTAVLIVQCLVFLDGGLLALGANTFNMAIVGVIGGYGVYRLVHKAMPTPYGRLVAAAFAAWCSTVLASITCAGQLAFSGVQWGVLPAMAGIHMLIGIGEAIITAMALAAIASTRPELLEDEAAASARRGLAPVMAFGLILALGLGIFLSPFKSEHPDGLERVAENMGFIEREAAPVVRSPIPDYAVPGISSPAVATGLAGGIGTVVVFGLSLLLARVLTPRTRQTAPPAAA